MGMQDGYFLLNPKDLKSKTILHKNLCNMHIAPRNMHIAPVSILQPTHTLPFTQDPGFQVSILEHSTFELQLLPKLHLLPTLSRNYKNIPRSTEEPYHQNKPKPTKELQGSTTQSSSILMTTPSSSIPHHHQFYQLLSSSILSMTLANPPKNKGTRINN
jgi:hypothetical protein